MTYLIFRANPYLQSLSGTTKVPALSLMCASCLLEFQEDGYQEMGCFPVCKSHISDNSSCLGVNYKKYASGEISVKQTLNIKVMMLVPSRPLEIYCLMNFGRDVELSHSTISKEVLISMIVKYNNYLILEL